MATRKKPAAKTVATKSTAKRVAVKKTVPASSPDAKRRKTMPAAKRKVTLEPKAKAEMSQASTYGALSNVAGQLLTWADKLGDFAGPVANMSLALAKSQIKSPGKQAAIKAAGVVLRQAREAVGMSAQEVGQAINLKDPGLLEQVETGKAALPFETILRLAGVLGRHDPISFALKLTRSYYPDLWSALDALGVGKLAMQAGREREFANLYRRRDAARRLNDEEFAALLTFTGSAFDMGLEFFDRSRTKKSFPKKP